MATIIFDFDDTLYNTQKLKEDINKVLSSYSVEEIDILNSYKTARDNLDYNFEKHLLEISKKYKNLKTEKILEDLNNLFLNPYLFKDVGKILNDLNNSHTLILLTNGEEKVQKTKISNSGVGKYFHTIHITQKDKVDLLKDLNLEGDVYFVNDKIEENKKIKEFFPLFDIIEIKNGKLSEFPIYLNNQ